MNNETRKERLLLVLLLFMLGSGFAQSLRFRPQQLFLDNSETCIVADVNRDGKPDVIAGRNWYPAPDFVPQPLRPIDLHPPDYARNNGEHAWDVDQDGWVDVLTTGWGDGHIYWMRNPGEEKLKKGLTWEKMPLADTHNKDGEAAYMYDLDADGTPEYIMNSYDNRKPFTVWRLDKDLFGDPVMTGTLIGPHNSHGVGFGDINGDGRMDILYDRGWYEQPAQNPWAGNWPHHADWQIEGKGSCPMQVVDLNGDGRNDLLFGQGHDYGLYWMEQGEPLGGQTTWTTHVIDETWSQVHAMAWADLDGDGLEELITGKRVFAHSGKDPGAHDPAHIFSYEWDPARQQFTRQVIAEGNIGTGLFIRVADLNADQHPDIVVAGKTGTYILWQE